MQTRRSWEFTRKCHPGMHHHRAVRRWWWQGAANNHWRPCRPTRRIGLRTRRVWPSRSNRFSFICRRARSRRKSCATLRISTKFWCDNSRSRRNFKLTCGTSLENYFRLQNLFFYFILLDICRKSLEEISNQLEVNAKLNESIARKKRLLLSELGWV